MEASTKANTAALFQVYLRLRPPHSTKSTQKQSHVVPERFLTVETPSASPSSSPGDNDEATLPTYITINPPVDSRKRAIERFGFTRVFEEATSQLQIFEETGHVDLINSVIKEGRDGLMATLGVTGSGKSHTILGTKSQRGITQLTLDYLFKSLGSRVVHPVLSPSLISSLDSVDSSEAQIMAASNFIDTVYGDGSTTRAQSRATTPAVVNTPFHIAIPAASPLLAPSGLLRHWRLLEIDHVSMPIASCDDRTSQGAMREFQTVQQCENINVHKNLQGRYGCHTQDQLGNPTKDFRQKLNKTQEAYVPQASRRHTPAPPRPASFPSQPSLKNITISSAPNADYAVVVSMYEVYNDRIFDLLQTNSPPPNARGERQRRPLLFKSTEGSPDRKVVAGLQKVVCGSYEEAMMVLETGLTERRVAGTGSNSVSSRSHGFFVLEIMRRDGRRSNWQGGALTIVDLAGSERAKNSKTAGSALAEAGKINESLMYLGQCLQMQSDAGLEGSGRAGLVPFRQCKLTELLFANSPAGGNGGRASQKSIMLVTADPLGDFNATSQILRYSALAREITVPRIPSVASTVPFTSGPTSTGSRPGTADKCTASIGRFSPDGQAPIGDLVAARDEAERLSDEVAILAMRLAEEQARRREVEASWISAQDRIMDVEREVREECFEELERRLDQEKRRWTTLRDEEKDQMDEEIDRKIELLESQKLDKSAVQVYEDEPTSTDSRVAELEDENSKLRARLASLEREMQNRSPVKMVPKTPGRSPSKKSGLFSAPLGKENQTLVAALGKLDISAGEIEVPPSQARSPSKKLRRLTPRDRIFAEDEALGEEE